MLWGKLVIAGSCILATKPSVRKLSHYTQHTLRFLVSQVVGTPQVLFEVVVTSQLHKNMQVLPHTMARLLIAQIRSYSDPEVEFLDLDAECCNVVIGCNLGVSHVTDNKGGGVGWRDEATR